MDGGRPLDPFAAMCLASRGNISGEPAFAPASVCVPSGFGVFRKSPMVDVVELRKTAKRLREWAKQIRRNSDATPYATSIEDSGLLDKAAGGLEDACDEITRLSK